MEVKVTDDGKPVGNAAPQVRVTNKNDFDIEDMHDGVPYIFPAASYEKTDTARERPIFKAVTIPPDAAAHIFAYGAFDLPPKEQLKAMFAHIAKRFGWNRAEMQKDGQNRGWDNFRKIDIRPVMFRLVEESQDEEGARGQRGKTA